MHLALTDVVLIFIRPNNGGALKAILSKPVESIVNARDLDLCIDPVSVRFSAIRGLLQHS
jgi:hypothetical protein